MTNVDVRILVGRRSLLIGGRDEPGEGEPILVADPATEEVFAEVRAASPAQADRAARRARAYLASGGLGSPEERSAALHRLAELMAERSEEMLHTVVSEVGTPISTARALHVDVPIAIVRWHAEAALRDRTERLGTDEGRHPNQALVLQRPVGAVLGITAYNYPPMFAATKIGAAIAAGCPIVLLPSPQAPLTTLLFADLVLEAGLGDAVSVVLGGVDVAQRLIASPDLAKVSFTGSVQTGRAVMRAAADSLSDVVLELGGKGAAILLPSADAAEMATAVHQRYLRNAGQGCASPTRILVHQDALGEFVAASKQVYADVVVGDPWDADTLVGPVISAQHRQRVKDVIETALRAGGEAVAVGSLPAGPGWYVRPTLLGGLDNAAPANQEEIFGPVASVQSYRDVDEAVRIANDSSFGLHSSIFGDLDEAIALAPRLEVGHVTINGGGPFRPDAPIGGVKLSGIGREHGEAGIKEYLEPLTVQWPEEA